MDTFKIPKQIKYNDEIVAGMTVREALLLGIFAIPAYAIFRSPIPFPLRVMTVLPIAAAGLTFAFYKHKGRNVETWLFNWLMYKLGPKSYKNTVSAVSNNKRSLIGYIRPGPKGSSSVRNQVPIVELEDGMIRTTTGYAIVLQVGSVNYRLMSEDSRKKLWSSFRGLLNLLSLGFPLQFHIVIRRQTIEQIKAHFDDIIENNDNPILRELARAERDFVLETIKSSSVVSRSFYVVIPFAPNFSMDADYTSIIRQAFTRSNKKGGDDISKDIVIKQLSTRKEQVLTHLKKLGIEGRKLGNKELFEILYDSFNPTISAGGFVKHDVSSVYKHIEKSRIVNFITPPYMDVGPDYVDMAGVYMRTLFPLEYPGSVSNDYNWIQPLIDSDEDLDISIHVSPLDTTSVIKVLTRNYSKMISTKRYRRHKGQSEDFHLEAKSEDTVYLLEKLIRAETKLFNVGIYSTVRALDLESLDQATDSLTATLESIQVTPGVAKYQMASAIATNLPVGQDRLCYLRNFDTDSLATAMPLSSSDLSAQGGILYGINSDNSSLVTYNRFKHAKNANSIVMGCSGSGKSWLTKLESVRYLIEGVSVVIIDPEREYQRVCAAVGGQYITISRNPEQHINPFDPYVDAEGVRGIDRQVGDALVLIRLMAPDLEISKSALEDVLYTMFREKDKPVISDLHRVADEKGLGNLAEALYPWHQGSLSHIFSQPTDVDMSSEYIVFDISEMDEDLRPVAMQVILSWLWRQIFAFPKPRLVYVDEAWCLLESAGEWFSAAFRRARKHWCGFTITEHQVETLLNSDIMKAILVNSATKVLLAQEASALPALAKAFDLTEGEQTSILGASPGEGLLYAANTHVSLKVISPSEYNEFLTTSPDEVFSGEAVNV